MKCINCKKKTEYMYHFNFGVCCDDCKEWGQLKQDNDLHIERLENFIKPIAPNIIMNKKHEHKECEHTNLNYCSKCDVVYCVDCDREWGSGNLAQATVNVANDSYLPYWWYLTD